MLLPLPVQNNIAGIGMARQLRKKSGTGIYHMMLRGINRQDIFEDEGDEITRSVLVIIYGVVQKLTK